MLDIILVKGEYKMDNFAMRMYAKLLQAKRDFCEEECGAVDIVAIVVLIGIAVVLALFFKDQIVGILRTLFSNIDSAAQSVTNPI